MFVFFNHSSPFLHTAKILTNECSGKLNIWARPIFLVLQVCGTKINK